MTVPSSMEDVFNFSIVRVFAPVAGDVLYHDPSQRSPEKSDWKMK